MAHPEEPTLPEDTGQRKNKNINNVLLWYTQHLKADVEKNRKGKEIPLLRLR